MSGTLLQSMRRLVSCRKQICEFKPQSQRNINMCLFIYLLSISFFSLIYFFQRNALPRFDTKNLSLKVSCDECPTVWMITGAAGAFRPRFKKYVILRHRRAGDTEEVNEATWLGFRCSITKAVTDARSRSPQNLGPIKLLVPI